MLAADATLTSSFPHRMEMIRRRGWSSSSCSASECRLRSRRSFCRSRRESEKSAVSDPEK